MPGEFTARVAGSSLNQGLGAGSITPTSLPPQLVFWGAGEVAPSFGRRGDGWDGGGGSSTGSLAGARAGLPLPQPRQHKEGSVWGEAVDELLVPVGGGTGGTEGGGREAEVSGTEGDDAGPRCQGRGVSRTTMPGKRSEQDHDAREEE